MLVQIFEVQTPDEVLEELIGAPVVLLSTSPEREDTVLVRDPFAD